MRNAVIGIVIGIVVGIAVGTAFIAPRLPAHDLIATGEPPDRAPSTLTATSRLANPSPGASGFKNKAYSNAGKKTPANAIAKPALPLVGTQEQTGILKWRLASAYSSTLPQMGTLAKRIETEIWKVSGGKFEIKFHEPGALISAPDLFSAVASGTIEAAYASPSLWAKKIPALSLFSSIPFGPRPSEYLAWIYFGGGREAFEALYHKNNNHSLVCGINSPEAAGWFRKEVVAVEDLRGVRMRASGLGARVLEKLGVKTTTLPPEAIYRAFESGLIDATEYSMPAVDQNLGLERMVRYYYFPGWQQQSTLLELIVNLDSWKSLNSTQRAQIEAVCGDNIRYGLAESEALQFAALKGINKKGVTIRRWPPEILDALKKSWAKVVAEEAVKDRDFARIWKSLSSFREEYSIWRELGYL